jgi:hypothetical protein
MVRSISKQLPRKVSRRDRECNAMWGTFPYSRLASHHPSHPSTHPIQCRHRNIQILINAKISSLAKKIPSKTQPKSSPPSYIDQSQIDRKDPNPRYETRNPGNLIFIHWSGGETAPGGGGGGTSAGHLTEGITSSETLPDRTESGVKGIHPETMVDGSSSMAMVMPSGPTSTLYYEEGWWRRGCDGYWDDDVGFKSGSFE